MVGSAEVGEIFMRAFILRRVALLTGGRRGLDSGRPRQRSRTDAAAEFPRPQRLSAHLARCQFRRGGPRGDRAVRRAAGRAAADDLSRRHAAQAADRSAGGLRASASRPSSTRTTCMTWWWWARGPPALRPRSMPRPRGCRCWCSISAHFGGQAGASARIENYLGFPTGISGGALAGRAFTQAQKFGAQIAIPLQAQVPRMRRRGAAGRRAAAHHSQRRPRGAGAQRGDRLRRALSPARHPQSRGLRRHRRLVLGLAGRGEALRGRGGGAGRCRQLGRPGRGLSRAQGQAPASRLPRQAASRRRCRAI